MKKRTYILIIVILSVILGSQVFASTMDDLDKKKEEIEKAYDDAQKGLAESKKELLATSNSIKTLEIEILDMESVLDDLDNKLEVKQSEIAGIKLDLIGIREDKDTLHDQAKERIKVMYEYGNSGYLEVLFDSKDMVDFFNRLEYINRLVDFDVHLFEDLDLIEVDILAQEAELVVQEAELNSLSQEAESQKVQLEDKVVSKNLQVVDILEDQKLYEQRMDQLEEEEKAIDEEIKELIRKSKLIYKGGQMEWPVSGHYRLSSVFGPRLHPIYKTWRDHNGVDIPAPSGTPIGAAANGVVIVAKYSSSYGNYVIIDHGSGYATLYAHCSKLLVSVNQAVVRGETIGKVGTTGWSTGNHLHFGVQVYGDWVDPMGYVQ